MTSLERVREVAKLIFREQVVNEDQVDDVQVHASDIDYKLYFNCPLKNRHDSGTK